MSKAIEAFKSANNSVKSDPVGSIKSLLFVALAILILFALIKFMKGINGLFGNSAKVEAALKSGKQEFEQYDKIIKWNNLGKTKTQIQSDVDQSLQFMSGRLTDWKNLNSLILRMTPPQFIGFFVMFGVRVNNEFSNMAGDFVDWVNKEKEANPLTNLTDPTVPIKAYINKIIASNPRNMDGIINRLKKINY
jgi:hypothetical protein